MKLSLLIPLLFLLIVTPAYAGETSYRNADSYYDLVSWSNPTNGYTADNNYAIKNSTQFHAITYHFPSFNIPQPVTPKQLVISLKIKNDGSRVHNIKPTIGNTQQGDTNNVTIPTNDSTNVVITYQLSNYPNITKALLNTNHGVGVWIEKPGFPGSQTSIDEVKAKVVYDGSASSVTLGSSEASASGQWVKLDLTGDTATISANMVCKIGVFQDCTRSGFSNISDNSPSATIHLDTINATGSATRKIASNDYYGANWATTPTDTTWSADNIEVPYNAGFECTYKFSTYCSEKVYSCDENGLHCVWTDTIVHLNQNADNNSSLVVHPPEGLTSVTYGEPEPTNPLQWVIWSIKKTLWETFSPSASSWSSVELIELKKQLQTKEPFCYGYAVSQITFSNTASDTEFPALTIPVAVANDYGIPESYDFVPPAFVDTALTTVRTFLTFLFSTLFVLYVVQTARRIF